MAVSVSEASRIWEKVLKKIKEKLDEEKSYDLFFSKTYIQEINGNVITVVTPSNLSKIQLENQYSDLVRTIVADVTEESYILKYFTADEISESSPSGVKNKDNRVEENKSQYFQSARLNKELTFDNFIVGESNNEAHQAALYVARNGGKLFNPLFIYSNSGLGKTHLLHAIGNEVIKSRMPDAKILYIAANDFVEEYVKFIRNGVDPQGIRDYFRSVDILLFDDVQFLADKVKTEEFFFYIYQDMINQGKRIIITSDRQPNELKGLEDRLITRFSQGLTVSINEPDQKTSIEILRSKIQQSGIDPNKVDDSVLYFFADKFSRNVRELEGAVNRLIHYTMNIKNIDNINMDTAIEAVGSLKGGKDFASQLNEQKIINVVCDYYNVTPSQVAGKDRSGQIALARHISMYLIRNDLDVPLKKIGEMFGGKDHTTVMSAISKVDKELKTNEQLKAAIEELQKRIRE